LATPTVEPQDPIRTVSSDRTWQTLWTVFFAILLVASVIFGNAMGIAFGLMGLLAIGIARFWNRVALQKLTYERKFPQERVFFGDEIYMDLVLSNRKPIPLAWLDIEDQLPQGIMPSSAALRRNLQSGIDSLSHATAVAWYERIRWRYRIDVVGRGEYHIGPARMESGDPFGFFRSRKIASRLDTLVVYPKVYPLDEIGIPPARPLGEIRGGLEIFPDPSRPAGIREYVRGDPLKTIDWKATAKQQRLMVRTFEPSSTHTVIIAAAVDTMEPYWLSLSPEDLERVISIAASMALFISERQYSVGLFSNDMPVLSQRSMTVPPSSEPAHLHTILTALALTRPFAPNAMSSALLEQSRKFPFGSTIVLCTNIVTESLTLAIAELKQRGFRFTVLYTGAEVVENPPPDVLFYHLREHMDQMDAEERERKERESASEDGEDAEKGDGDDTETTAWDRLKDTVVGVGDEPA